MQWLEFGDTIPRERNGTKKSQFLKTDSKDYFVVGWPLL